MFKNCLRISAFLLIFQFIPLASADGSASINPVHDGWIRNRGLSGESYADIQSGAQGTRTLFTTNFTDQTSNSLIIGNFRVERSYYCFDGSVIGVGNTIQSASLTLESTTNLDVDLDAFTFVTFNPANISSITTADFTAFGSTSYSLPMNISDVTPDVEFTVNLDSGFFSNINKTGVFCIGSRLMGDINASQPTDQNSLRIYSDDQPDPEFRPVFNVSWTSGSTMSGLDLGSPVPFASAAYNNVFGVIGSTIANNIYWVVVCCATLLGVYFVRKAFWGASPSTFGQNLYDATDDKPLGQKVYGESRGRMGWDGVIYAQGVGLSEYDKIKEFSPEEKAAYNKKREENYSASDAVNFVVSNRQKL